MKDKMEAAPLAQISAWPASNTHVKVQVTYPASLSGAGLIDVRPDGGELRCNRLN
jgi:hypothetical protein